MWRVGEKSAAGKAFGSAEKKAGAAGKQKGGGFFGGGGGAGGGGPTRSETTATTHSWAGDEDAWQQDHPLPSHFGELRALTAGAVDEIRKAQVCGSILLSAPLQSCLHLCYSFSLLHPPATFLHSFPLLLRLPCAHQRSESKIPQKKLFEDHELLETVPGQDFDFLEAFEDTFHGEESSEARFKPLGKWFENKERVVERLTMHLEKACEVMVDANIDVARHIQGQDNA